MIRNVLRQFLTYGAGSIAQTALGFFLLPIFLRFFEPAEYGVISLLLTVSSLLNVLTNVGVESGLFRLYYEADVGERKKLVGTAWMWHLAGATLGATILLAGAPLLSRMVFHTLDYSYPVRLVGVFFFVSLLQGLPFSILRLEKKPGLYVGFSLFRLVIDFALKLYFIAFLKRGIGGYFESGIIAGIIIVISMLPLVLKFGRFSLNASYLRQLLRLGFPFVFSTIAMWALEMSDRLILNYYSGAGAVGIYSLAYSFANLFNVFLLSPVGLLWYPFFFSYSARESTENTKRLLKRSLVYFAIAGSILYLAISLGAADVLRIFTFLFAAKEGYWQAAELVPLVTLAPFLYLLIAQATSAMLLAKKPEFGALACCAGAAVNIGLNFILIPRWGALGAAISVAIAYIALAVLAYLWSQGIYHVSHDWKGLAKTSLFLAVTFMIGSRIVISQPWISLFTRLIAGWALFVLLVWFASNILSKAEKDSVLVHIANLGKSRVWRRLVGLDSHW